MPAALRIGIFRHAESLSNAGGRTRSVTHIPLTEKGHQQAQILAQRHVAAPSRIIHSPFLRARQTAMPLCDRFERAASRPWPIQEFTYLEPKSCINTSWIERKPRIDAYWQRLDPLYVDGEGAESFAQLLRRAQDFLLRLTRLRLSGEALKADIGARTAPCFDLTIVSHGQFMQACLCLLEHPGADAQALMRHFRDRQEQTPFANCEGLFLQRPSAGGREHVAQKWKPVLRNNMRQSKELEHGFDSVRTQRAPDLTLVARIPAP